ncbi:thrombospondin type-1 domain-containing protein 4 isoform X1 [Euwallacea similis]|uniref:thrombospondin type-1 domain-containing protein 4 isoform X1 n=1 Tax=Euwallacea similis TaxID=1736056 RepID=UPI00344F131C
MSPISIRWATTFVALVNMCVAEKAVGDGQRKDKKSGKYPTKVHDLYQNSVEKKPKLVGEWSNWAPWSSCSRSCGGGITQQVRHCITRPADSRFVKRLRRRRQDWKPTNECVGLYKRIHLCNTEDCPSNRDFRYEQCAAFNNRPFKGTTYHWEPYYQGETECALNCRPVGMKFYATFNKTVIDGTPCYRPVTSTGKSAPKGTKGVCIDGYCKSVNSQGVVGGSDDSDQHQCLTCLRGGCKTFNGIYTRPDLPPGYSLVAQIPKGACGIQVQQIKHTRNILALKISDNITQILNGDWKFSPSRTFKAAGTKITYVKQDNSSLETITASGPLALPLDIMIIGYQQNYGVKYRYALPEGLPLIAPPLLRRPQEDNSTIFSNQRDDPKPSVIYPGPRKTRLRRRNYHWKVTGLSHCSKTCGGGTQSYVRQCYRAISPTHQVPTNEKRCAHLDAPALAPVPCNVEPCPNASPFWDGIWGQCSVSCGEGVQQFIPLCKKDVGGKMVVVSDAQCGHDGKPSLQTRACQERECDAFRGLSDNELPQTVTGKEEWTVGAWSQCSVTCGNGHRTRSVVCPSGQCHAENRPAHVEHCHQGLCLDSSPSQTRSTQQEDSLSAWLVTDWSHCSVQCGIGNQSRFALCEHDHCSPDSKPETSRSCSSEKHCDGQWFAGPWGECSDSCNGLARQKREVLCIARIRGVSHVTNEMVCPVASKPYEEQSCYGLCPAQWFTGDWGKCEGACPSGVQRREVKCLDIDKRASNACPEDKIPAAKRPCACETQHRENRDSFSFRLAQDEPVDRSCIDKIQKCRLAVQARLCSYSFYTKNCCESCRRTQQDYI